MSARVGTEVVLSLLRHEKLSYNNAAAANVGQTCLQCRECIETHLRLNKRTLHNQLNHV